MVLVGEDERLKEVGRLPEGTLPGGEEAGSAPRSA